MHPQPTKAARQASSTLTVEWTEACPRYEGHEPIPVAPSEGAEG